MADYKRDPNPVVDGINKAFGFKEAKADSKKPKAKASPWIAMPAQPVAPDPMAAVDQAFAMQQVQAAPPAPAPGQPAAPDAAQIQAVADQLLASGQFQGPNAKLEALAAAGSPWAKQQLAQQGR